MVSTFFALLVLKALFIEQVFRLVASFNLASVTSSQSIWFADFSLKKIPSPNQNKKGPKFSMLVNFMNFKHSNTFSFLYFYLI